MWIYLLETWTPTFAPHTLLAFILIKWPPHRLFLWLVICNSLIFIILYKFLNLTFLFNQGQITMRRMDTWCLYFRCCFFDFLLWEPYSSRMDCPSSSHIPWGEWSSTWGEWSSKWTKKMRKGAAKQNFGIQYIPNFCVL